MNKPEIDPIDAMGDSEIYQAVRDILGISFANHTDTTGAIIEKLQEWNCSIYFSHLKEWHVETGGNAQFKSVYPSLQKAFLSTAIKQMRWHPPQPKKVEPEIEYWMYEKLGTILTFEGGSTGNIPGWKRVKVVPYE